MTEQTPEMIRTAEPHDRVEIDPVQLAAIRTEVMSDLAVVQRVTARTAEDSSDDPARRHHHTGMRDGASLAAEMINRVFERIARRGVILIDN